MYWQTADTWLQKAKWISAYVRYLHAVAQAVQLLVVDWSAAVRWAGLSTGRGLRRREDLVAAWDSSHCRESADLSPWNFFFVHLHRLSRGNRLSELINPAQSNNELLFHPFCLSTIENTSYVNLLPCKIKYYIVKYYLKKLLFSLKTLITVSNCLFSIWLNWIAVCFRLLVEQNKTSEDMNPLT